MFKEVSVDSVIDSVLNEMSKAINEEQLIYLNNVLHINLNNIQLSKRTYDLAVIDEENDSKKLERFIVSKAIRKLSNNTIRQYTDSAKNLRNYVNKNFTDITSDDIEYYMAKKQISGKWSDRTTSNQYNYLNVFFEYLVDADYITKNPMKKIKPIKVSKKIKKTYSTTDMEKIRNACKGDIRDIAIIEFFLSSALRVESVCRLKWNNLDMNSKTGIVIVKGGDEQKFRFNEKSVYYLKRYFDYRIKKEGRTFDEMLDRPLFVGAKKDKITKDYEALSCGGFRYIMKKIANETGITKLHPHKFRRTFACNAIAHGMPMEEVKEHLGHKDIRTTFIYAEIPDRKLEESYRTFCE